MLCRNGSFYFVSVATKQHTRPPRNFLKIQGPQGPRWAHGVGQPAGILIFFVFPQNVVRRASRGPGGPGGPWGGPGGPGALGSLGPPICPICFDCFDCFDYLDCFDCFDCFDLAGPGDSKIDFLDHEFGLRTRKFIFWTMNSVFGLKNSFLGP